MTMRAALGRTRLQEDLNFLLTNRIPRRLANRLMAWFSRIEQPLLARASITVWRLFADLELGESLTQDFHSLHQCFTRELKPGSRPVDPDPAIVISPCDAIVGACGRVAGDQLIQAKGFSYTLGDLLLDPQLVDRFTDGTYVTLRLTAGMYHRFHAPYDLVVEHVGWIAGDTWNVNPPALARVAKLFCKNERAVIRTVLHPCGIALVLVPVAAILVRGIRLNFADLPSRGTAGIACHARLRKGEEMGWFEHGSTIIVIAPRGVELCASIGPGTRIRMGQPLLRLPEGECAS
jgi:phosphatidylserine decarboxylase